jgi:hypothetical protein
VKFLPRAQIKYAGVDFARQSPDNSGRKRACKTPVDIKTYLKRNIKKI